MVPEGFMNIKKIVIWISTFLLGVGVGMMYVKKGLSEEEASLRSRLTELQYRVTQEDGTEPAFQNAYWDNKEEGIYVDIIDGTALFSSTDKYKSGTGWPSFTKPITEDHLTLKKDYKLIIPRTEVRSQKANSHLGHVFNDGPDGGLRYCLNSASLRFVPKEKMVEEGYGDYLYLFGEGEKESALPSTKVASYEIASFAAGCFWGVENIFESQKGVIDAVSGYMGGHLDRPTYEEVSTGTTGHAETVQVTYDPLQISYETLLDLFWRMHDPTTPNRQGPDIGPQYRSAIFYYSDEQKAAAEKSLKDFDRSGVFDDPVVTEIAAASGFTEAEKYHQNYYDRKKMNVCHRLRDK